MSYMKINLFVGLSTLLFVSCIAGGRENSNIIDFDMMSSAKSIEQSEGYKPIESKSLVYVPLQMTDKSQISSIDKVVICDSSIFVKSDNNLLQFDKEGKFIKTITPLGQGPKDVIQIFDFSVDTSRKLIYILDFSGGKISIYNFNNEFLSSFPIACVPRNMEVINSDILLTYINIMGNDKFKTVALTPKGDTLATASNYMKYTPTGFFLLPSIKNMEVFDKNMIIRQNFNDTIFNYNPQTKSFKAKYIFDFGGAKLPYDILGDEKKFNLNSSKYAYITDFTETNSYLYVNSTVYGKDAKYIFDKKMHRCFVPENRNKGRLVKNGYHNFWPEWYSNGYLIGYLSPTDLLIKKSQIKNAKLLKIIDGLNEESNPILLLYKE